jgi:hypothetical protein
MTRPHPALTALVALALAADAVMATVTAWHSTALAVWLAAIVLAYASALALIYAAGTIWHSTRNAALHRARRRLYAPDGRPRPSEGSRPVAPVDGRHARAMAAVAAEMPPSRPRTSVYGASQAARSATQLPQTQPLPALDDTVVMAAVGGGR